MDSDEFLERARAVLRDRAIAASSHSDVPVRLDALLKLERLGPILIERSENRHGGLREERGTFRPVVYRTPGTRGAMTQRERYTVAHEIAHAIVERSLRARPSRTRDYWALEDLCNEYAAEVLMPEGVVGEILDARDSLDGLLDAAQQLSIDCQVSLAASTKRVVGLRRGVAAWGLAEETTGWKVSWSAENPEVVRIRPGSRVGPSSPLMTALPIDPAQMVGTDHRGTVAGLQPSLFRRTSARRSVVICRVTTPG